MSITAHVHQIFIKAPAEAVWAAMLEPEWTRRYFHDTYFTEPPVRGARYVTKIAADGREAISGEIEELVAPTATTPGRFVQTWQVLYDAALAAEPPSRVEWLVEPMGPSLTRLRVIHGDLANSPLTWAHTRDGWGWILGALKTVLETGEVLPDPEPVPGAGSGDGGVGAVEGGTPEGDWHRRQGVEANNSVWDLLAAERSAARDEELLRRAYTAAYHWERATGAGPENQVRADYMIAKALLATDQPARALITAERCLRQCEQHGLADFDLVYAYEVLTRALLASGRVEEARQLWSTAEAIPVADPEDLAIVEADTADLRTPWPT